MLHPQFFTKSIAVSVCVLVYGRVSREHACRCACGCVVGVVSCMGVYVASGGGL